MPDLRDLLRRSDERLAKARKLADEQIEKNDTRPIAKMRAEGKPPKVSDIGIDPVPRPGGYSWREAVWGAMDPPKWAIRDVLPEGAKTVVFGQSGALKSFVTLDMACCIASGIAWHGHEIATPGGVLVILLEGQGSYRKRLRAWALEQGFTEGSPDLPVWICPNPLSLLDDHRRLKTWIAEAEVNLGTAVRHVVVDTFSLALGSGDENSNADVSRALANADEATEGRGMIYVHHPGHGEALRERGAYQFRANADVRIVVERSDENRGDLVTVSCVKQKDDEEFAPIVLEAVKLDTGWRDDIGRAMTSLVLRSSDRSPKSKAKLGNNERAILALLEAHDGRMEKKALRAALKAQGIVGSRISEATRRLIEGGVISDGMTSYGVIETK